MFRYITHPFATRHQVAWALQKADEFKNQLENRDEMSGVTPGMFRESAQADRVYFIEDVDVESNRIGNIFVRSVQNGKLGTMVAREGFQETLPNGDRFLVMLNGTRYEGTPGQRDYRIVEFERYAMRIESAAAAQVQPNAHTMSTPDLWRTPTTWNLSELEWRLGLPISAAVLALLAIPLSYVIPCRAITESGFGDRAVHAVQQYDQRDQCVGRTGQAVAWHRAVGDTHVDAADRGSFFHWRPGCSPCAGYRRNEITDDFGREKSMPVLRWCSLRHHAVRSLIHS